MSRYYKNYCVGKKLIYQLKAQNKGDEIEHEFCAFHSNWGIMGHQPLLYWHFPIEHNHRAIEILLHETILFSNSILNGELHLIQTKIT